MKKVYISPIVKVIALAQSHALLTGTFTTENTTDTYQLSREKGFDWDDDEEEDTGGWFK